MRLSSLNPYDFSHPVKDPLLFAGRRELLADVGYYLEQAGASDQPVSLAIIGPRASGKTSLLNVIEIKARDRGYLVARVDLDEADTVSPLTFCHRLVGEIMAAAIANGAYGGESGDIARAMMSLSFGDAGSLPSGLSLQVLEAWAAAVRANTTHLSISTSAVLLDLVRIRGEVARPIVVLIDEADTISANPVVLQKLRNIFQRAEGYFLVLAGTDKLFPELDRVFSPVSRQFKTMVIGAFDHARETEDCIVFPLRKVGLDPATVMDSEAFEVLHDIARGRPYEVKLLCHFMYRRAQESAVGRMQLDLEILEEVRHQLERERNIAARPILTAIRALDQAALQDLAVLVGADGNATVDELWQAEYAIHGVGRYTQAALAAACQRLTTAGIVAVTAGRVAFCGDDFDRLYATYFGQARGIDLVFPPRTAFPLDIYWSVIFRRWLRGHGVTPIGVLCSGEDRKQLDDVSLYTVLNALSGATTDSSVLDQNLPLAFDLYRVMEIARSLESVPIYRIRLRVGLVDVTGLFSGLAAFEGEQQTALGAALSLLQVRLGEMQGSLEIERFMLPVYSSERIEATVAERASEPFRRLLANVHAAIAIMFYSDKETRDDALHHAELTCRYGADVWPQMSNNVAYVLLAGGRVPQARALLQTTLRSADGSELQALVHYNLGIALAQLGEFDLALEQLGDGYGRIGNVDEEGRRMLYLIVGTIVNGKLSFTEEEHPDLAVAFARTRAAITEARGTPGD